MSFFIRLAILLCALSSLSAKTIYVDAGASGNNDGIDVDEGLGVERGEGTENGGEEAEAGVPGEVCEKHW